MANPQKLTLIGGRFICWDKSCGGGSASSFCDAEFAWTNIKNPRSIYRHFWCGATRKKQGEDHYANRMHVSQKPVALMRWVIEHCRVPGDAWVLDPYMGSGTTGIAALSCGRRFIGVEIDPAHFNTAVQRIKNQFDDILV